MKLNNPCKGCKYYTFIVSRHYHAIVEGCNRQDWGGIKKNTKASLKLECYAPAEEGKENN